MHNLCGNTGNNANVYTLGQFSYNFSKLSIMYNFAENEPIIDVHDCDVYDVIFVCFVRPYVRLHTVL